MKLPSHLALAQARERHADPFPVGSAVEREALQRFSHFYSKLEPKRVEALCRACYAPEIWFSDGLKIIEGIDELEAYLIETARAVELCQVEIDEVSRSAAGDYLLRWTMRIRFKRFQRGVDRYSIGVSHLRYTARGQVCYQQDYWDSGANLFEHVPVLGWAIRRIKARL